MFLFDIPTHKLIIHFPIALTIIAVIYDSWALYARRPELHRTSYGLTLWAAVGSLAAAVTGLQLAEIVRIDKAAVTGHAGFGVAATIVIAARAGVRYSAHAEALNRFVCGAILLFQLTVINLNQDVVFRFLRVRFPKLQLDVRYPSHLVFLWLWKIELEVIALAFPAQLRQFAGISGNLGAERSFDVGDFPPAVGQIAAGCVEICGDGFDFARDRSNF